MGDWKLKNLLNGRLGCEFLLFLQFGSSSLRGRVQSSLGLSEGSGTSQYHAGGETNGMRLRRKQEEQNTAWEAMLELEPYEREQKSVAVKMLIDFQKTFEKVQLIVVWN